MNQRGFTLLEILLSVALASALIIMASNIYDTVRKVGQRALSTNKEWGTQYFLRLQFEAIDAGLNNYFSAVDARNDRLSFISRNSAQFGHNGQPVLVTYRYNSGLKIIQYHEVTIPPWWDDSQQQYTAQIDSWRQYGGKFSMELTAFSGIDSAEFEYWEDGKKRWSNQWNDKKMMPPLARLTYHQAGQKKEIVFAPGVLSWSTASGS